MSTRMIRIVALLAVLAAASIMGANAYAKQGADDPPKVEKRAGHGADDPAGDDRKGRGRGSDDAVIAKRSKHHRRHRHGHRATHSRHGADDPAGDDRKGSGKRGGRRNDDRVLT